MNKKTKAAGLLLKAVVFFALTAGISCTKPSLEPLLKKADKFIGVYVLENYAQGLPRSRSPLKAAADAGADLVLDVGAASWGSGNGGGAIEGLQPTAAQGVYLIVPAKNQEYPSDTYPNSGDRVEIVEASGESVVRLKWRDMIYRGIGEKLSSPRGTLSRWTNMRVLAGEYTERGGRRYLFTDSEEARWPDRTFSYTMELDLPHSREPNCDFIRVTGKLPQEYLGFRWENGKLLIFRAETVVSEDGHLPLVQPGSEKPFKCSQKPFLVLTPGKNATLQPAQAVPGQAAESRGPEAGAACGGAGGTCDWDAAVAYCREQGGRLPTAQELRRMYDEECAKKGQAEACKKWYWSSTEENSLSATGMRFFDGDMHSGSKISGATGIRCVR